jgi:hypothetical protein
MATRSQPLGLQKVMVVEIFGIHAHTIDTAAQKVKPCLGSGSLRSARDKIVQNKTKCYNEF